MDDKIELVAESGNNLDTYKALRQKIARTIDESKNCRLVKAITDSDRQDRRTRSRAGEKNRNRSRYGS